MPTTLLAPGTSALDSAAVTVPEGSNAVIYMTAANNEYIGAGEILILIKRANATFTVSSFRLLAPNNTDASIPGPCVFKVRRHQQSSDATAVGCDQA